MWKHVDISNRSGRRVASREKDIARIYRNATERLSTGEFDKIMTKERCMQIIDQYKDDIPKQNKFKRFAATIGDFILMII